SKADRSIIDQTIQTKTNMLVYVDSGTKEVEVPADKQDQPALTADQLSQLVGLGLKIEQHYGAPQDIEWAFEEGRFWIVQSRPVTT
ncbi:MAG TPA: PEP/pyruvate-binding domain-containing protein, partial [Candidatus Saccharimonadales bacterium]|nr:PEP/pyruvate-binding domain-containing protein [Candidatus Saccharimonadales bacterium]